MGLKEEAYKILHAAYQVALYAPNSSCCHQAFINFVIDNTHLTYKYILFTAILSKAADESINPLCLQKQSMFLVHMTQEPSVIKSLSHLKWKY